MNKVQKEALVKNRRSLVTGLGHDKAKRFMTAVFPELKSRRIFDDIDEDNIMDRRNGAGRVDYVLKTLKTRGPKAFDEFCVCLACLGNGQFNDLASKLKTTEALLQIEGNQSQEGVAHEVLHTNFIEMCDTFISQAASQALDDHSVGFRAIADNLKSRIGKESNLIEKQEFRSFADELSQYKASAENWADEVKSEDRPDRDSADKCFKFLCRQIEELHKTGIHVTPRQTSTELTPESAKPDIFESLNALAARMKQQDYSELPLSEDRAEAVRATEQLSSIIKTLCDLHVHKAYPPDV